jgi:DNA-binding MarR family transcriptional regulator
LLYCNYCEMAKIVKMAKPRSLAGTPIERASRWMFTKIISSLARTLRDEEMSVPQLAALHVVDQVGELRQSALAEELALSPSAASRLVDGLVQRGLLLRRELPDDRRARVLALSPRGVALLDEIGAARTRLFERITGRLPRPLVKLFISNVDSFRETGLPREGEE